MLPTKGYFQDIECPFYDSQCNRPYCHFRHRKKSQEINEATTSEPEVPTYKPTPKSELANIRSHIPISYVPDLAFRSDRTTRQIPKFSFDKPTYKPTPKSILSSASKKELKEEAVGDGENGVSEENEIIREIQQNIASVKYNPEVLENDINFEDLSAEFDLIDDIIEKPEVTKTQTKEKDKEKSKLAEKKSSSSKDRHKERHKSKHHKKEKDRNKSAKKEHRSRHKSHKKHSTKEKDKKSEVKPKKSNDIDSVVLVASPVENILCDVDNADFDFDEDTIDECYKIFTEYEAPKKIEESPAVPISEPQEEISTKKRIAHAATGSKLCVAKPKAQISPAMMMANRLKLAKQAQASNEQKNLMEEMRIATKRPPVTLPPAAVKKKKIAPVQNVSSIQRAKEQIELLARQRALQTVKTIAQTQKRKRVAHVPDVSLSDIPDVLNADKSKLPINVRTRFLTMIADECVKLYLTKEDAYNRALNEEFACYEKCKVLITYKNSAMLAVSRLRKEIQERERLDLGPLGSGESLNNDVNSDFKGGKFYNRVKKWILNREELEVHGYPRESSVAGRAMIPNRKLRESLGANHRKCARCRKVYPVDDFGFVLYEEECLYHPLKKRTLRGEQTYLCCKSNEGVGCVTSSTHVTDFYDDSELEGFQMTLRPESDKDARSLAVYALDCEMCYTIKGLELTRVTIVDSECKTVYESLVKPLNPIIDYNTTFSGITREQMERTSTSILQAQANILHLCNSRTILIGHSLESDMKALKIIHGRIIDTSVLFPHKMGLPHKRALKTLASEYLKKIIQNSVSGHDSAEDAIACMELVKWKLKEEFKLKGVK